jgi:DNA-binding transcriptional MerR regulator
MYSEDNFYTISKASEIIGVKAHVLRFWEKKIKLAKPNKFFNGRRYYSSLDIKNLLLIKKLLYDEGFTIKGAINFINNENVKNNKNENFLQKLSIISSLILDGNNLLKKHIP